MMDIKKIWRATKVATSSDELRGLYKDFAVGYDALTMEVGYQAPRLATQYLSRRETNLKARILDLGCGTGLVGQALWEAGYVNIDGLDFSPEMLQKAKEKNVYRQLFEGDLNQLDELTLDRYDALICVGVVTLGHVKGDAVDGMLKLAKPGGHLCLVIRDDAYEQYRMADKFHQLEEVGVCQILDLVDIKHVTSTNYKSWLCMLRVL